jgi:hypothetical protein
MTTATLLTWVLAAAPETPTPTDIDAPASIEVTHSDSVVQVTARGSDGEVSAELYFWRDDAGNNRLDAMWPDGLYFSVASFGDGGWSRVSPDPHEAARRLDVLASVLEQTTAGSDWKDCVAHLALAAPACATHPVLCAFEMYYAGCACLPLLDEFEGEEC